VLENGRALRRKRQQRGGKIILFRQARGLLPLRLCGKRLHRLDRLKFRLGDDGEKIAVANHFHDAGHSLDRSHIAIGELRAVARRPHHACMHHIRQPQVLHISGAAGDFGRDIDARDRLSHHGVGCGVLQP
jgi:hypothetical protein